MPKLIAEMREDVIRDNTRLISEIVVLSSRGVVFSGTKPRFAYFRTEHPNLLLEVDWLESVGALTDVTSSNTRIYRMHPVFRAWLEQT